MATNERLLAFPISVVIPPGGVTFDGRVLSETKSATESHTGMDLRDYFAAKAMQSLILVLVKHSRDHDGTGHTSGPTEKAISEMALQYADAMIAARNA